MKIVKVPFDAECAANIQYDEIIYSRRRRRRCHTFWCIFIVINALQCWKWKWDMRPIQQQPKIFPLICIRHIKCRFQFSGSVQKSKHLQNTLLFWLKANSMLGISNTLTAKAYRDRLFLRSLRTIKWKETKSRQYEMKQKKKKKDRERERATVPNIIRCEIRIGTYEITFRPNLIRFLEVYACFMFSVLYLSIMRLIFTTCFTTLQPVLTVYHIYPISCTHIFLYPPLTTNAIPFHLYCVV